MFQRYAATQTLLLNNRHLIWNIDFTWKIGPIITWITNISRIDNSSMNIL